MKVRVVRGLEEGKKALARKGTLDLSRITDRVKERSKEVFGETLGPEEAVRRILEDVRSGGDEALRHYSRILDKTELDSLEVSKDEISWAVEQTDKELLASLKLAASRIREYHESAMPKGWMDVERGLGERLVPLERAGLYAPGGTAAYPSTVLMSAVPARVAGVEEVILCSPTTSPVVLAAAAVAGVERVFRIGGAQAVGAMAYGTASVPKVDIICGPGNIFVTLAKKMVYGDVGIDGLYGPTETVIVADGSAEAAHCAADLLAQAEHDSMASPILITDSLALVAEVEAELGRQAASLERRQIAELAVSNGGCLALVGDLEEAIELANYVAPEHMCLVVAKPWKWAGKVRNAGGLFLGHWSPEVAGDYIAGPSHVMPTGGTARFSSALGVRQFLRTMPVVALREEDMDGIAEAAARMARAEGLTAHARAMEIRIKKKGDGRR
jgi:histidinol dehydrogenase